jgi:hypothetical protein
MRHLWRKQVRFYTLFAPHVKLARRHLVSLLLFFNLHVPESLTNSIKFRCKAVYVNEMWNLAKLSCQWQGWWLSYFNWSAIWKVF